MTPWKLAFLRRAPKDWRPNRNDVVYLPRRRPYLRSARGRISGFQFGLVMVRYVAHQALREAPFFLDELRPCRGTCRVPVVKERVHAASVS